MSLGYKSLGVAIKNITNAASQSSGTNKYQSINHTTKSNLTLKLPAELQNIKIKKQNEMKNY